LKATTPSAASPCSPPLSIFTMEGDDCVRAVVPIAVAMANPASEPRSSLPRDDDALAVSLRSIRIDSLLVALAGIFNLVAADEILGRVSRVGLVRI
jgi:hypothetical protein